MKPIIEIPNRVGVDRENLEEHDPLFTDDEEIIVIAGGIYWHIYGEVGEFAVDLSAPTFSALIELWTSDATEEHISLVSSLTQLADALCDSHFGFDEKDSKRALDWANHMEAVATNIRARVAAQAGGGRGDGAAGEP